MADEFFKKNKSLSVVRQESSPEKLSLDRARLGLEGAKVTGGILGNKFFLLLLIFLVLWSFGGGILQTVVEEIPLAAIIGVIAIFLILK